VHCAVKRERKNEKRKKREKKRKEKKRKEECLIILNVM